MIGRKTNTTIIIQNIIEKGKIFPNPYWYLNPHEVRVFGLSFIGYTPVPTGTGSAALILISLILLHLSYSQSSSQHV